MAKKEKSKDYSVGGGKKWIIGFAVLVLIAIVVVVVLTVIPPDTSKAVNLLNKVSTTSYLKTQTEKTEYDNFETKIKNTQQLNEYITKLPTEMADVQNLSYAVNHVLDYYNDSIMFANKKGALSKNYKSIMNGLNGAVQSQKKLNAIIEEVNELSKNSSTYLQSAWSNYRTEYLKWLGHNKKAIDGLRKAYQGGMGNTTNNNLASTIVLNAVSDYLEVIYEDFSVLVDYDTENPNASTYSYVSQGRIDAFCDFVTINVLFPNDIQEYYFQSNIREKYQTLNSFYELYLEPDLTNVISSIKYLSGTNVVTKTYTDIDDKDGIYNKIKAFVVGG